MAAPSHETPREIDAAEPKHESATTPRHEGTAIPGHKDPATPRNKDIAASERCGPLLVERHRKADGRRLILYRRVADDG
jgi:hypothetical protein